MGSCKYLKWIEGNRPWGTWRGPKRIMLLHTTEVKYGKLIYVLMSGTQTSDQSVSHSCTSYSAQAWGTHWHFYMPGLQALKVAVDLRDVVNRGKGLKRGESLPHNLDMI